MIDPKRLTDKDRGREFLWLRMSAAGPLVGWDESALYFKCKCCNRTLAYPAQNCTFAHGTYQDGGAE